MRNTRKLHLGPPTLALFAAACLLSCAETPLSEVFVYYTADEAIAQDAGCLRVDVFSADDTPLAPVVEDLEQADFPIRLALSPASNNARTGYRLAAELFEDGCDIPAEFATSLGVQEVKSTFVQNQKREIWIVFDADCAGRECPGDFRCQERVCVEYCVEPQEPAAFEGQDPPRSAPVPCGEPCTEDLCQDDLIKSCAANGASVITQECGFGCGSATTAACTEIVPSNVGEDFEWQSGLADLVVEGGQEIVFDTDSGLVVQRDDGQTVEGIDFQSLDLGTVEVDTFDVGGEGTAEVPIVLGIFAVNSLQVMALGSVRAEGSAGFVLLANTGVEILGSITADANEDGPGPGGFAGGEDGEGCGAFGTAGCGPGGGGRGRPKSCGAVPCLFPASTGGGGGSYGAFGGLGGLIQGEPVPPGSAGLVYRTAATPNLLIGGSGGGAGGRSGNVPPGGHGGGAIQISTNGLVRIGANAIIAASGAGGAKTTGFFGGGAGGSGGMVLLEAGSVLFDQGSDVEARIGASGGAGGGATASGANGAPGMVPAPGGDGLPFGGDGSNQQGRGATGGTWTVGGGGGGGGGRVSINTRNGESDRDELLPFVTPRSDTSFTVGQAATKEPE